MAYLLTHRQLLFVLDDNSSCLSQGICFQANKKYTLPLLSSERWALRCIFMMVGLRSQSQERKNLQCSLKMTFIRRGFNSLSELPISLPVTMFWFEHTIPCLPSSCASSLCSCSPGPEWLSHFPLLSLLWQITCVCSISWASEVGLAFLSFLIF